MRALLSGLALALALAGCGARSVIPPITPVATVYGVQFEPYDDNVLSGAAAQDVVTNLHAKEVRVYWQPADPNGVVNPDNGYTYGWVPAAVALGLKIVFITPYPPANPSATFITAYAAYVAAGAAATPGQIWELDNEPDNSGPLGQAQLTAAQYVALMEPTIAAIRAADPTAKIITGGTSGVDYTWINAISALWPLVDGVAIHPYPGAAGSSQVFPPAGTTTINNLRGVIANMTVHTGKPTYVTEWGEAPQVPADIASAVSQVNSATPLFNLFEYECSNPAGTACVNPGPVFGIVGTPSYAEYASVIDGL